MYRSTEAFPLIIFTAVAGDVVVALHVVLDICHRSAVPEEHLKRATSGRGSAGLVAAGFLPEQAQALDRVRTLLRVAAAACYKFVRIRQHKMNSSKCMKRCGISQRVEHAGSICGRCNHEKALHHF